MEDKTIQELAEEWNVKVKTIQNTLYKLKKDSITLGTLKDNQKYYNSNEQNQLKSALPKQRNTKKETDEELLSVLKERITFLEKALENEQQANAENRILLKSLSDSLDSTKLLLETKEQPKGFFERIFGK